MMALVNTLLIVCIFVITIAIAGCWMICLTYKVDVQNWKKAHASLMESNKEARGQIAHLTQQNNLLRRQLASFGNHAATAVIPMRGENE